MNRIPTLDCWRGIAIALVLFDHFQSATLGHYLAPWTQTGAHGVAIFFVLSGYLITSKLTSGRIDLKKFYVRRVFRLMPAAWTYIAFLLLVDAATGARLVSLPSLTGCILFFRNFLAVGDATQHFWSLSVEEQFYLVWPCVLLLAGLRGARWFAISAAAGCAWFRWSHWAFYNHPILNRQTQVSVDAMLVGCLLALLLKDEAFRSRAQRWSRIAWAPALVVLVYCVGHFPWLPPLTESSAIAVLIAASSLNPNALLARPLSLAPLAWLGGISYSAYLWQQVFARQWGPLQILMLGVLFPACALASYYWIEKPCVRLGHRLTTAGTGRRAKTSQEFARA